MIPFFAGLIIGFILAAVGALLMAIYIHREHEAIEKCVSVIAEKVKPSEPAVIIEADSEADEARKEIIGENKRNGKDTKLSELYDQD